MGSYDWTMGIRLKNFDAEFRWRERSYGGEYLGYEASVVSPTGEDIGHMLPEWKKDAIFRAASTLRRAELQDEWDLDMIEDDELKPIILQFFERSLTGEYLGNMAGNEFFLLQDLAGILGMDEEFVTAKLRELAIEKKLSLTGNVLRPYDPEYELPRRNQWSKRGMRR